MRPRWQDIEKENPWLQNEYYDFDQDKEMIEKYKIDTTLPTFIFLDKNNQEFLRLNGEIDKEKIIEIINQNKEK